MTTISALDVLVDADISLSGLDLGRLTGGGVYTGPPELNLLEVQEEDRERARDRWNTEIDTAAGVAGAPGNNNITLFTGTPLAGHFLVWLERVRAAGVHPMVVMQQLGISAPSVLAGSVAPSVLWDNLRAAADEVAWASSLRYPEVKVPTAAMLRAVVRRARRIVVMSGAGLSVAAGIPDFRSRGGIYSQLGAYPFSKPEDMFDMQFFLRNPFPFFDFIPRVLPGRHAPTYGHHVLATLDGAGRLLRNYTQNIDGLEQAAGMAAAQIVQCHGTFASGRCLRCEHRFPADVWVGFARERRVPLCPRCDPRPAEQCFLEPTPADLAAPVPAQPVPSHVIKPDITFFGEGLFAGFDNCIDDDAADADLFIAVGSSCQVRPVVGLLGRLPRQVPQILLNRELVDVDHYFDFYMLGDAGALLAQILAWAGLKPENAPAPAVVLRGTKLVQDTENSRIFRLKNV